MIEGMRKPIKIVLIIAAVALISGAILILGSLNSSRKLDNLLVTNISSNSVRIVAMGKYDEGIGKSVFINGKEVYTCTEDGNMPCLLSATSTDNYRFFELSNLAPETIYTFEWRNSPLYSVERIFDSGTFGFSTEKITSEAPIPSRLYGKVSNEMGDGIEGSLVIITSAQGEGKFPLLSAVTNAEGLYSVEYNAKTTTMAAQNITAYAPNGEKTEFKTISAYNLPVADLVIDGGNTSTLAYSSPLVHKALAADSNPNACFTSGMGGIRVQCGEKVDWLTTINPQNCPAEIYCEAEATAAAKKKCIEDIQAGTRAVSIRVGIIQHDSVTHFYPNTEKASTVSLRIYDKALYDKSGASATPVTELVNGAKLDLGIQKNGADILVMDKEYVVKGVVNGKVCGNMDNSETIIKRQKATKPYPIKTVDPITSEVNMCQKFGENFGEYALNISSDQLTDISKKKLSWALGVMSYDKLIPEYRDFVIRAKAVGVNTYLRICDVGNCPDAFKKGKSYGNRVAGLYNELDKDLPQNGLYVQVGHNEPNAAEFRKPSEEAQFIIDTVKTLEAQNIPISAINADESGVKLIGPSFDLFNTVTDKNRNLYTAKDYLAEMLEHPGFVDTARKYLYAWAVNHYILNPRTGDAVLHDVDAFYEYLGSKTLRRNIFVTEIGKSNSYGSWSDFNTLVNNLDKKDYIKGVFFFKSTTASGDFEFNKDFYKNAKYGDSCTPKKVKVPQEGASSAQVENKFPGVTKPSTAPQPSSEPVAVKAAGTSTSAVQTVPANVLGEATVKLKDEGEYIVKSTKYQVATANVAKLEGESGELKFFLDTNGDGIMNNGEQYIADTTGITVEKVGEAVKIPLKKGVNMISLPIYSQDTVTAKKLMDEIASQGGYVTAVGIMNNTVATSNSWSIMNVRGASQYSKDFSLVNGKGMYVIAQQDSELILRGSSFAAPVSVFLRQGWNLVSLQGVNMTKYPTAKTVLDEVNKTGTIEVSTISAWDPEKQAYQTYIKAKGSKDEYGTAFKLDNKDSMFIYVTKGSGYWTPQ